MSNTHNSDLGAAILDSPGRKSPRSWVKLDRIRNKGALIWRREHLDMLSSVWVDDLG